MFNSCSLEFQISTKDTTSIIQVLRFCFRIAVNIAWFYIYNKKPYTSEITLKKTISSVGGKSESLLQISITQTYFGDRNCIWKQLCDLQVVCISLDRIKIRNFSSYVNIQLDINSIKIMEIYKKTRLSIK